ncbi:hypothetical protein FUSO6_02815 [Fusobacterium necrophorum DAB]|uniref:Uncharacterized protein n=1 Tax=Fusobacterium necrophorum DJ-2 TaxID=1441737 RepID=A0AB73C647_9FUSO|nr:hypothetical protein FUSO6_02815 [Fusobacterium necrophorum DAB]KDE73678.1 hypothetical protein FUSO8_00485 [Fusobacterium necrophorum DJ-2]KDE74916.1 hypothetical protein FUSO7_00605 [Fusobacterium necrophorum BFTR-2]
METEFLKSFFFMKWKILGVFLMGILRSLYNRILHIKKKFDKIYIKR